MDLEETIEKVVEHKWLLLLIFSVVSLTESYLGYTLPIQVLVLMVAFGSATGISLGRARYNIVSRWDAVGIILLVITGALFIATILALISPVIQAIA